MVWKPRNNFQQKDMSNYLSPYRVQQVVKLIWNKKHRLRGDKDNDPPPQKKRWRYSYFCLKDQTASFIRMKRMFFTIFIILYSLTFLLPDFTSSAYKSVFARKFFPFPFIRRVLKTPFKVLCKSSGRSYFLLQM